MNIDRVAKLGRLIDRTPIGPPPRIYGWLATQLSIARHYGGIDYQGHRYAIAINEPDQPLVRADVLEREAKEAAAKLKAEAAAKLKAEAAEYAARQGVLL